MACWLKSQVCKLSSDKKNQRLCSKFNYHSDRNSEQSLASFFSPISFWSLLTWNASDFSDGTSAKFAKFFGVQLDERRKGFLFLGKILTTNPTISFRSVGIKNKQNKI
jgi:hypothetical protein